MNDQEYIKEEIKRQLEGQIKTPKENFQAELINVGGGALGTLGGVLSINAIDEYGRLRKIKAHNEMVDKMENERNAWKALREIKNGTSKFEDYGEAADVLREMYANNDEMLSNDEALDRLIREKRPPGRIDPIEKRKIPDDIDPLRAEELKKHQKHLKMNQYKRFMPNASLLDDFGRTASHPAVAIGGLVGLGAGMSYNANKERLKKKDTQWL